MNELKKSINDLINMIVQYKVTIKKSAPSALVREASTFEAKGKKAGCWNKKKGKAKAKAFFAPTSANNTLVTPKGIGKGKRKVGAQ
ncbi:UNVERIFIED_CONTAM: hypothetical protein Sradi_1523800 [Sesamum radiatum]|uniref:Uncharacterized protein n=1 Tax=Sesamum radiatum TaxID=300843 RepID=A0AAW2UBQ4_SESRA